MVNILLPDIFCIHTVRRTNRLNAIIENWSNPAYHDFQDLAAKDCVPRSGGRPMRFCQARITPVNPTFTAQVRADVLIWVFDRTVHERVMPPKRRRAKSSGNAKRKGAQVSPFELGQIKAHMSGA